MIASTNPVMAYVVDPLHAALLSLGTVGALLWIVAVGFLVYFARGPVEVLFGG